MDSKTWQISDWIKIIIIPLIFTAIRLLTLLDVWLLPGLDGGYYAIQVENIMRSSDIKYDAPPIAFFIFAFFTWLLSSFQPLNDAIINGVKIGLSIAYGLSFIPVYVLSRKILKNRFEAFIVATLFMLHPFYVSLTTASLFKNSVGTLFLVIGVLMLYNFMKERTLKNAVFLGITITICEFTHILCFGIIVLFSAISLFFIFILCRDRAKLLKSFIVIALIPALATLSVILFKPNYLGSYWKLHSYVEEVAFQISSQQIAPGPQIEYVILLTLAIVGASLYYCLREFIDGRRNFENIFFVSATILGFYLSYPFMIPSWRWRFQFMLFIPFTLSFIKCFKESRVREAFLISILIFAAFIPATLNSFVRMKTVIDETMYNDLLDMRNHIEKNGSVIIARFGLNYWVEYILGVQCKGKLEVEDFENYSRVYMVLDVRERPPPGATLVYRGSKLVLLLLRMPP
ncbi:hypothetical protein DRO02_04115 [archaeon]|nr:MAG: hypothetical protein DRO02_04115 [archaeon]